MKPNILTREQLVGWLADPHPAVFLKVDLLADSAQVAAAPLTGCAFIGCLMDADLTGKAAAAGCVILPPLPRLDAAPFDPYTIALYTPEELYSGYDPHDPATSETYFDRRVYLTYMDASKQVLAVPFDVMLLRRLHDATVGAALEPIVEQHGDKIVAIMGGHDRSRKDAIYGQVARMALTLSQAGYTIATGGGPGLMEAGNLGAYCAGFADPEETLARTLDALALGSFDPMAPHWDVWLKECYTVWKAMGKPADQAKSRSLGIPTWFYGHEPPNVFATDIAKYFENSVREEGLLGIARAGVIYAEGNGGTVQEIFQDACQNYYRNYGKSKSPMVLFGSDYWNPDEMVFDKPKTDKRKKVFPLLKKLATEKGFFDYVHITDSADETISFIVNHPPAP